MTLDVFKRRCAHNRILGPLENCEDCLSAERVKAYEARGYLSDRDKRKLDVPQAVGGEPGVGPSFAPADVGGPREFPFLNDVQPNDSMYGVWQARGSCARLCLNKGAAPYVVLFDARVGSWVVADRLTDELKRLFVDFRRSVTIAHRIAEWLARVAPGHGTREGGTTHERPVFDKVPSRVLEPGDGPTCRHWKHLVRAGLDVCVCGLTLGEFERQRVPAGRAQLDWTTWDMASFDGLEPVNIESYEAYRSRLKQKYGGGKPRQAERKPYAKPEITDTRPLGEGPLIYDPPKGRSSIVTVDSTRPTPPPAECHRAVGLLMRAGVNPISVDVSVLHGLASQIAFAERRGGTDIRVKRVDPAEGRIAILWAELEWTEQATGMD